MAKERVATISKPGCVYQSAHCPVPQPGRVHPTRHQKTYTFIKVNMLAY